MKRIAGASILLMGVALGLWIVYNMFIHRMPETQGRSLVGPLITVGAFVYVGAKWLQGKTAY